MKTLIPCIIFVMGSFNGFLQAQSIKSKNLSLAGYVGYETLYNGQTIIPADHFTIKDIASWTDTRNGNEYALICLSEPGDKSGVALVDVTDPDNPIHLKTIRYPNSAPQLEVNAPADVKVHNNIAYIAQDHEDRPTYWVDLQTAVDNENDEEAGVTLQNLSPDQRIHTLTINKDHQLLFLSHMQPDQDIPVFDISGSSPTFAGTRPVPQSMKSVGAMSHDMYVLTISSTQGRVFDANLASVTATDYTWNNGTLTIGSHWIHEFNPLRGQPPNDFSNAFLPHNRVVHSTWIGNNTDYLFTTVEGDANTWDNPQDNFYQRANYLSVWKINPINQTPTQAGYRWPIQQVYEVRENDIEGSFDSAYFPQLTGGEEANSIHNIVTRGNESADTAFISCYTKGLRVLDVTNPTDMSEIAFYDIDGFETYIYPPFNGAFGVDPLLPSRNVLVSSSDGLYVFHTPGTFAGSIDVNTIWSGPISVIDDLAINSETVVQGSVDLSLAGDINASADIGFASSASLTITADKLSTISASDGTITIGDESTLVSSTAIAGGSGPIKHTSPETETTIGEFAISHNYPNPFNPVTTIEYSIPEQVDVKLDIFDVLGPHITTLVNEQKEPGTYRVTWDASGAASGLYIYRIQAGQYLQTRQMILLR